MTHGKKIQYQYYKETGIKPVYADLMKSDSFAAYARIRKKMFEYNLGIPISTFRHASVLEFGPSTGDNSLIFAHWGADLTLVEPVAAFIDSINEYFRQYGLIDRLFGTHCNTFEDFETQEKFDYVVAEGFLFHTGSPSYWLPRISSFGKENAFVIISHLETAGYIIELLHAKCLQVLQKDFRGDPVELARHLYYNKWSKVNHSRSFDSWAYDNVVYPTLDAYLLNSVIDFQEIMNDCGMLMWSSWPSVVNYTDLSWVKDPVIDRESAIDRNRRNFLRLLPSMVLGELTEVNSEIDSVGNQLFDSLCSEVKALAVNPELLDHQYLGVVRHQHEEVDNLFKISVRNYGNSKIFFLWQDIKNCLEYLSDRNLERISELFNGNTLLGSHWGSPNFYSVWHRYD